MASPCPDITITAENSVQGSLFDEALVTTDADFTSHEDCDMFASFYYQTPAGNADISESPLLFSNLDVIVDGVWKPEAEQGFALMFQAVFNWLKSFGFNVDMPALQEHLPSGESVRLFTEITAGLILLLAFVFILRGLYRAGFFRFSRKPRSEQDEFKPEHDSPLSFEPVDGLPLREQLAALLQRSIALLQKYNIVPVSASYTNHELVEHLDASNSAVAKILVRQVNLTEPVIYGARSVTPEVLSESRQICEDIGRASDE